MTYNTNNHKYTNEDLKTMQSWDLQRKIQVTQTRIIEWYQKNNGKVYVSFSGGKDSTVLLDLARRIYPDIPAVFIDTGLEYPELRDFVESIPNVVWLKPEMNFRQVIEKYGYPLISKEASSKIHYARIAKEKGNIDLYNRYVNGERVNKKTGEKYTFIGMSKLSRKLLNSDIPVHNECCGVMKKRTVKKYERQTGNKPILGTMACESKRRRSWWFRGGCNSFDSVRPMSQPMAFWTEQDVLKYLKMFDIPYASVYGEILQDDNGKYYTTKCDRTGCVFCAYGAHLEKEPNRFQRLK